MRYLPLMIRKSDHVKTSNFTIQILWYSGQTVSFHFQNWLHVSSCVLLLLTVIRNAVPGFSSKSFKCLTLFVSVHNASTDPVRAGCCNLAHLPSHFLAVRPLNIYPVWLLRLHLSYTSLFLSPVHCITLGLCSSSHFFRGVRMSSIF